MTVGASKINKYLICHASEYTGDDKLAMFPCQPKLNLSGSNNMVSTYAYRDFFGRYHELLVNNSAKVQLEFVCIGQDKIDKMNSLIINKIEQYGTRTFYANVFLPTRGWYFSKWYVGTPLEAEAEYLDTDSGEKTVVKYKFDLIEVDGTVVGVK